MIILENMQEESRTPEQAEENMASGQTEESTALTRPEEDGALQPEENRASEEGLGEDEGSQESAKSVTPTFSYFIRILCGGYLVYLSYGLFTGEGADKPIILAAAGLFALVGIFLVVISVMGLLKKKD